MPLLTVVTRILWAFVLVLLVGILLLFNGGILTLLASLVDRPGAPVIGFGFESLLVLGGITPLGQRVVARLSKFRKPTGDQQDYLETLLNRVRRETGNPRPIIFHVMNIGEVNAFALGTRHIGVTQGFFGLPAVQQEAILAHELGHLSGGDSMLTGVVSIISSIGNWIGLAVGWMGMALFGMGMLSGAGRRRRSAEGGAEIMLGLGMLSFALITLVFRFLTMAVWSVYSRRMEYHADAYAAQHGYREALAAALIRLDRPRHATRLGLAGTIWSSHPATWRRLRYLERLGAPTPLSHMPTLSPARHSPAAHAPPPVKPAIRRIRHF